MKKIPHVLPLLFCMAMIQSCNPNDTLLSTDKILVTSESGDKLTEKENITNPLFMSNCYIYT